MRAVTRPNFPDDQSSNCSLKRWQALTQGFACASTAGASRCRESRKDTAAALSLVPYAGVLALAIPGGDLVYPPGTRARARILADVMVPPPDPDAALTTPSTGATP